MRQNFFSRRVVGTVDSIQIESNRIEKIGLRERSIRIESNRIESNRKNRSSSRNRIESNRTNRSSAEIESNRSSIEVHGTVDSNRFDPKILLCKKSHKFQSPKRSHASCVACIPENGQFDPNWLESNEKIYFRAEKKSNRIESNRKNRSSGRNRIESIESNRTPAWIESNRIEIFFKKNRIERIESNPSRIESNRIDASGTNDRSLVHRRTVRRPTPVTGLRPIRFPIPV